MKATRDKFWFSLPESEVLKTTVNNSKHIDLSYCARLCFKSVLGRNNRKLMMQKVISFSDAMCLLLNRFFITFSFPKSMPGAASERVQDTFRFSFVFYLFLSSFWVPFLPPHGWTGSKLSLPKQLFPWPVFCRTSGTPPASIFKRFG